MAYSHGQESSLGSNNCTSSMAAYILPFQFTHCMSERDGLLDGLVQNYITNELDISQWNADIFDLDYIATMLSVHTAGL